MTNKKTLLGMLGIALVFGVIVTGCSNGTTSPKTPEEMTPAERWQNKWVNPSSFFTINTSVDAGGVCTITVGGIPDNDFWNGAVGYLYTGKKDAHYTYVFEAWTNGGTRNIGVQYFGGGDVNTVGGPPYLAEYFAITSTRATYTFVGEDLPWGGAIPLEFQCADQLGTFYVKIISITEGGERDSIKIRSVTPDKNLTETNTTFTVVVDYTLVSSQQGELHLMFNPYAQDSYSGEGDGIVVNKGSGSYTLTATNVIPKNWGSAGEFCVLAALDPYPHGSSWSSLDVDIKALSF